MSELLGFEHFSTCYTLIYKKSITEMRREAGFLVTLSGLLDPAVPELNCLSTSRNTKEKTKGDPSDYSVFSDLNRSHSLQRTHFYVWRSERRFPGSPTPGQSSAQTHTKGFPRTHAVIKYP